MSWTIADILMYLNGALYSLLGDAGLLSEARTRGLDERLRTIQKDASPELAHQIGCILEKLEGSGSSENAKEKESGDEKNISEEDESATPVSSAVATHPSINQ